MELFKLLSMFIYFLSRKLCKFSVILAPSIMIGPTIHAIASRVILNPNILCDNIPLISADVQRLDFSMIVYKWVTPHGTLSQC